MQTEDKSRRNSSGQLFDRGIHLVHGLKAKMKNKPMPMWDKIMLRKKYIIECINELLKNMANLVHSRHRPIHNFIINLCSALATTVSLRTSLMHCLLPLKTKDSKNYFRNNLSRTRVNIYKENGGELYKHCRHRLKHRKRTMVGKRIQIPDRTGIAEHPMEIDGKRFGDFEMDTIIRKDGHWAIVTIIEQSSNMLFMRKLD